MGGGTSLLGPADTASHVMGCCLTQETKVASQGAAINQQAEKFRATIFRPYSEASGAMAEYVLTQVVPQVGQCRLTLSNPR